MASDRELVGRCRKGDDDAIRELVERFQNDVFGLCIRILRHRHDAEDVTQEVFVRIFRSLNRWDPTRSLKPWILTIAVNRCRTAMAKRNRKPETADYLADVADKEVPPSADELSGEIALALDDLRSDYREVFILYHELGKNYEEIAEIVERPVGTVKTWLHRARQQVLEVLQAKGVVPKEE